MDWNTFTNTDLQQCSSNLRSIHSASKEQHESCFEETGTEELMNAMFKQMLSCSWYVGVNYASKLK